MKEIDKLIEKLEIEINKTPTGDLRNLLTDANVIIQHLRAENDVLKFKIDRIKGLVNK